MLSGGSSGPRLLERFDSQSEDSTSVVSSAAIAGNYAALTRPDEDPHYGGSSYAVDVFDLGPEPALRSSAVSGLAVLITSTAAEAAQTIWC